MLGFGALGQLALGQAAGAGATIVLTAQAGAFGFAGKAAVFPISFDAAKGAFVLSGRAATFKTSFVLPPGAYSLTGGQAPFRVAFAAGSGSHALTGQTATVRLSFVCGVATLSLTGPDPYLSKIFQGGGDDVVIGLRHGGPAFTRKRYRDLLAAAAAEETSLAQARERREQAAREAARKQTEQAAKALRTVRAARDRAAAMRAGELTLTNALAAGAAAHDIEARFTQSALLAALGQAAQAVWDEREEEEAVTLLLAA